VAQIFIANTGNRDVQIEFDGTLYQLDARKQIENRQINASEKLAEALGIDHNIIGMRHLGKWLLDNFDRYSDKLRLPILQPVFNELGNRVFDKTCLVATNQPDTVPPFHRDRDTIFVAQLISRLAEEQGFNGGSFKYIEIKTGEPDRYDEVYLFLGKELRNLISTEDVVVAALSGGIPAINAAIRDHVLGICGKRAALIQTKEPSHVDETGRAEFISSWHFRRDQIYRQIRELLSKSYDYAGALNLLEDEGFAEKFPEVCAVLNHADKRSQFDWKASVDALQKSQELIEKNSQVQQWYESANHKTTLSRLREVMDCTEIAFRRSHWRDFIVLAETFVENAWRILAEPVLELQFGQKSIGIDRISQKYPGLANVLKKNKKVTRRGKNYQIDKAFCKSLVNYQSNLTGGRLQQQLESIATQLGQLSLSQQNRSELILKIEKIDKTVNDLRNRVVHRMANLSKIDLEDEAKENFGSSEPLTAIIKEMRDLFTKLGEPTKGRLFIYKQINDFVLQALESKED